MILPQNDGVSHFSRTDENYRPGQGAATVEWANALLRNRGLYQFLVRGVRKVRAVLLWHVLAHNLVQTLNLRQQRQTAGA